MSRIVVPLVAAAGALAVPVCLPVAQIQGMYSLPRSDFVWNWGSTNLERRRGAADIDISGTEAQFRCELTAKLRASSTMSEPGIRDIERNLASRLDFIYAATEAMNYLEQERVLDWATLDCKEYDPPERTAEEKATREQEARDKMLRELERRRQRQQRNAQ